MSTQRRLHALVMRAKLDLEEVAHELTATDPRGTSTVTQNDEDLSEIRARLDALESRVRVVEERRDGQSE